MDHLPANCGRDHLIFVNWVPQKGQCHCSVPLFPLAAHQYLSTRCRQPHPRPHRQSLSCAFRCCTSVFHHEAPSSFRCLPDCALQIIVRPLSFFTNLPIFPAHKLSLSFSLLSLSSCRWTLDKISLFCPVLPSLKVLSMDQQQLMRPSSPLIANTAARWCQLAVYHRCWLIRCGCWCHTPVFFILFFILFFCNISHLQEDTLKLVIMSWEQLRKGLTQVAVGLDCIVQQNLTSEQKTRTICFSCGLRWHVPWIYMSICQQSSSRMREYTESDDRGTKLPRPSRAISTPLSIQWRNWQLLWGGDCLDLAHSAIPRWDMCVNEVGQHLGHVTVIRWLCGMNNVPSLQPVQGVFSAIIDIDYIPPLADAKQATATLSFSAFSVMLLPKTCQWLIMVRKRKENMQGPMFNSNTRGI